MIDCRIEGKRESCNWCSGLVVVYGRGGVAAGRDSLVGVWPALDSRQVGT